jgi:endoglucanase
MGEGRTVKEGSSNQMERVKANRARKIGGVLGALGLMLVLVLFAATRSHDTEGHVRVNQIGYEASSPIRAYLMAMIPETGGKFEVRNSQSKVVYSAEVGQSLGSWGKYQVYALDFTLAAPETYTIAVSGPAPGISPSFRVDDPGRLYSAALANALSFYQNQRDGADFIPSALRPAASHLNDRRARVYNTPEFYWQGSRIKGDLNATGAVIDASGGWWDAGDYLKFVHTTSYTVALMLVGVRDFPQQMGAESTTSDFSKEGKFGLDWLQRMWDDKSQTLYYQVGIGSHPSGGEDDHSVWRLPDVDDAYGGTDARYRYIRNRPVFIAAAGGSKISPNLAGRMAGDFALCFRIYRGTDPAYANQCLSEAQHVFDLADTSPAGRLLTAAPYDFYGETEWRDDMEFGATELYLAMGSGKLPQALPHSDPQFYLRAAADFAAAYIHSTNAEKDTLVLGDISGLAHYELYRALTLAGAPSGLAVSQADVLDDMKKKLDAAVGRSNKDAFGYGVAWGVGDTPSHGAGLAVMASEYDYLTKSSTYAAYARGWMANILGANAWGTSFIVGDGSTFPRCIHHQVANLAGSKNGAPPVLAGALVEGPVQSADSGAPSGLVKCPPDGVDRFSQFDGNGAEFRDNAKYYSTAEPAIDLTAPSMLLFSWQMAGAPAENP